MANKVVVESSLVLLSHPEAVKAIGAAAKVGLTGISDATGQSVWKAGDAQAVLDEETVAFTSYTLEFSGPVRIADFHDAVMKSRLNLQYSLMHFRRPGDPIGRDYKLIQQREDSGSAAAAATSEAAPSEATPSEATPSEAAPSEAAPSEAAPSEATPSEAAPSEAAPSEAAPSEAPTAPVAPAAPPEPEPVPYGETSVEQLTDPTDFTPQQIDLKKKGAIKVTPIGNGSKEFYADFGIVNNETLALQMFRVRGPTPEAVRDAIVAKYRNLISKNIN
jgi:hypothetical protein